MSNTGVGVEFVHLPLEAIGAVIVAGLAAVAFVVLRNRKRV